MKVAYNAKKAAKEAGKVRMQQKTFELLRKVSSPFNISSLFPSILFIFTAAAALPPPLELFSPAVFEVGDLV